MGLDQREERWRVQEVLGVRQERGEVDGTGETREGREVEGIRGAGGDKRSCHVAIRNQLRISALV